MKTQLKKNFLSHFDDLNELQWRLQFLFFSSKHVNFCREHARQGILWFPCDIPSFLLDCSLKPLFRLIKKESHIKVTKQRNHSIVSFLLWNRRKKKSEKKKISGTIVVCFTKFLLVFYSLPFFDSGPLMFK